MNLLLDTGVLGELCHPTRAQNLPVSQWLESLLTQGPANLRVFVPEVADYELRRKLLHLARRSGATPSRSLRRLDQLGATLDYLALDTLMFRRAADLWAAARRPGALGLRDDHHDKCPPSLPVRTCEPLGGSHRSGGSGRVTP